jgi:hypothetical protein
MPASSPSLTSSEELFVYLLRSRPPRLHEALWIAEYDLYCRLGDSAAAQLQAARIDDDRLEEAIGARDEMRHHRAEVAIRVTLAQFLDKYPNITFLPFVRPHPGADACAKRALMGVAALGGSAAVFRSSELLSKVAAMLRNLASTAERLVLHQISESPSELMMHSVLLDLSRLALHSSLVGGGTLSEASATLVVDLLHVLRSTVTHRVSEEVRAAVSLACAELLAFFDAKLPSTITLPKADRRATSTDPSCFLTGARLHHQSPSVIEVGGAERQVTAVSRIYWNATFQSP